MLLAAALAGCVRYHPRPLSARVVARSLRDPVHAALVREAARLRMQPLAPVRLDFSRPLSTRELGVIAVLANPDLVTLRARERVASAQVFAAGLLPDPVITAQGLTPYGPQAAGRSTAYNAGFLFGLSRLFARPVLLRIARDSARATRYRVVWQEWVVANQARMLGTRLYWLRRSRAAADAAAHVARHYAAAAQRALRAGAFSQAGSATAEALALSAEETAADYARQVLRTRIALNAMLGLKPVDRLRIAHPDTVPARLPPASGLLQAAIRRRFDLVALRAAYAASENRLDLAVLQQYPQLDVGLAAARNTTGVTSAGWQVSLTLPLSGNRGAIAVTRARRAVLYHAYLARIAHVRSDIYQLRAIFTGVSTEIERIGPRERRLGRMQAPVLAAQKSGALGARRALLLVLAGAQAREQYGNLRMLQAQSYIGLTVASGGRWRNR